MAREVHQHTIDGYVYSVNQLGAKEGRKLLARIIRALLSVSGGDGESFDPSKLESALSDTQLEYLCDTLAATTQFFAVGDDSKAWSLKDKFDEHFAGRYGAMFKWIWAALQTNYGSFLNEFGFSADGLAEKAKAALSGTPTTSATQPFGASSKPVSAS